MKKILTLFLVAVSSAVLLQGCVEETFPTSGATASQVGNSDIGLDGLVRSLPSVMTGYHTAFPGYSYTYDFGYPGIIMMLDSMTGDVVITGNDYYNQFDYFFGGLYLGKEYGLTDLTWYNYYPWIKNCNDIIRATTFADENEMNAFQRHYRGIALTFRAMYYMDLVRLFEPKEVTDPNIHDYVIDDKIKGLSCVIITEKTTEDEARYNPRATVEDVYDLILSDLTQAAEYLEDYVPTSKQMPSVAVVYGMLARAYLERGTAGVDGAYAEAAKYARLAIDNGGYSPLTQDQWEDPTTGFNSATSNQSWMWCISYSATNLTNLSSFMAQMSNEETWTNYGWNCGRGINSLLYAKINDDDFRKHSWLDPQKFDFYNYKSCLPEGSFSIGSTQFDGYKDFFANRLNAYASIKFRPGSGNYSAYKTGNLVDVPLMRIEEMYLIEAEALAGAEGVGSGKARLESFMRSYRSPSYTCTASEFKEFCEEVALQARIEFWGEGIGFWYKKRLALGMHLENSNCQIDDYRFECDGIVPWWNFVISLSEEQTNLAIEGYNNPGPSGTLDPIVKVD